MHQNFAHRPARSFPLPAGLVAVPALLAAAVLSACAGAGPAMSSARPFDQARLPEAVRVPAGHRVAVETVGVGRITYECRAKAGSTMGEHEWVFVSPEAVLNGRDGRPMGRYYGPPATWEAQDGSKFSGAQLAVAPAGAGHIPLQLVKANPAQGSGVFTGATYVQRVATVGGVAPAKPCATATAGQREIVTYQADYIVWKAS